MPWLRSSAENSEPDPTASAVLMTTLRPAPTRTPGRHEPQGARGRGRPDRASRRPAARPGRALRADDGAAVAEFPLVAVLIIVIALGVVQAALIMHTRNSLTDAAVQGAHHASLVGSEPEDGARRAEQMITDRFGSGLEARAAASQDETGIIRVQVTATLPLVGLFGPSAGLSVEGRALDEEAW